jgi:AcrR family transcriptional regulator
MPVPRKSTQVTRERLVRAAERCFTDYGYEGSSLRRITQMAGVNLAAVNYHFSSKRELWLEVMQIRLAPLNQERVRMLESIRAATPAGRPMPLDQVCEAMFLPLARVYDGARGGNFAWARMVGRAISVPTSLSKELNRRSLDQFWRVFHAAMRDALPGMPAHELDWKFYFMMSSMIGSLAWQGRQPGLDRPLNMKNIEPMMKRLAAFVCGGMKAAFPAPAKPKA